MKVECDIVLLSYESPDLLEKCVRSVLDETNVHSRLIIVDNGSRNKKVASYLNSVHSNDMVDVEKVFSEKNVGFSAGINKGLRLSDAPYVCILNNDCIVTKGWLREMIQIAKLNDSIGLVNPQSNTFGSVPDEGASYSDHAELISDRKGRYVELGHTIGFACLIKREVLDRIGFLDETYKGVCYEDTDFSVRASKSGFIPVVAEGAYVFHKEQASRRTLKGKDLIYRRNRKIFESRWGKLLRVFFHDSRSSTSDTIYADYDMLKGMARQRMAIEVWTEKEHMSLGASRGVGRRRMIRHADIHIKTHPRRFNTLRVIWRVLIKKKKFDAVIIENGFPVYILRFLSPLHKTEVFCFKADTVVRSGKGMTFDLNEPVTFAEYLRTKKRII